MNANPAALTARADSRLSPPRRAFASFFQVEITLEKRRSRTNQEYRDLLRQQDQNGAREEARRHEHRKCVEDASKRIKFERAHSTWLRVWNEESGRYYSRPRRDSPEAASWRNRALTGLDLVRSGDEAASQGAGLIRP